MTKRSRDADATIRPGDRRNTGASAPGSDFGPPMSPSGSSRHGHGSGHRPSSSLTVKSDMSRTSHSTHSGSRLRASDDGFFMDRPSDEDIQAMFLELGRAFDVDKDNLSIESMWLIIYESEKKRWREERDKNKGSDKRSTAGSASGSVGVNTKDTGEYYIQKFMTNTITPKDIQGLGVSLRTMPLAWFHDFIDTQGIAVLASRLNSLNRPGTKRWVFERTCGQS